MSVGSSAPTASDVSPVSAHACAAHQKAGQESGQESGHQRAPSGRPGRPSPHPDLRSPRQFQMLALEPPPQRTIVGDQHDRPLEPGERLFHFLDQRR